MLVQQWSDRVVAPFPIRKYPPSTTCSVAVKELLYDWLEEFCVGETWHGVFTVTGCIPVYEIIAKGDISKSVTTTFYDVVAGLANPNEFLPPPECRDVVIEEL